MCFFLLYLLTLGAKQFITSLGEEGAGLCASRAFVCFLFFFALKVLVFVLLLLGVGGWLRFVIVALPGLLVYQMSDLAKL